MYIKIVVENTVALMYINYSSFISDVKLKTIHSNNLKLEIGSFLGIVYINK